MAKDGALVVQIIDPDEPVQQEGNHLMEDRGQDAGQDTSLVLETIREDVPLANSNGSNGTSGTYGNANGNRSATAHSSTGARPAHAQSVGVGHQQELDRREEQSSSYVQMGDESVGTGRDESFSDRLEHDFPPGY